ncbi:AVR7 protein, partial [Ciconia maguari]|nr:AVR7 protein [Ciconia maguari]
SAESPLLQCVLTGHWMNDLGSNMTIGAVNATGDFSGLYNTTVADNPSKIQESPLLGSQ